MKIMVVSDTHGRWGRLSDAVRIQPKAEVVIHLGDGAEDLENVRYEYPEKMMVGVAGNCDFMSPLPGFDILTIEGRKIFFTHGHIYNVKYGCQRVIEAARQQGADICLFGHTHVPVNEYHDGLYLMNPGSLGHPYDGQPTYGIIEIVPAGIVTNIVKAKL